MYKRQEQSYNPKLTAARVALAKTESEIEKLLDTLSGANPLLLQYANNKIEELDAERQKQLKLVADLTANSVSDTQIDSITNYLNDWESVSFDDKRKVVDILISHIDATSDSVACLLYTSYYPDFSAYDFLIYVSALKGLDEKAARKKSKEF